MPGIYKKVHFNKEETRNKIVIYKKRHKIDRHN
jgi:hypothetical protein